MSLITSDKSHQALERLLHGHSKEEKKKKGELQRPEFDADAAYNDPEFNELRNQLPDDVPDEEAFRRLQLVKDTGKAMTKFIKELIKNDLGEAKVAFKIEPADNKLIWKSLVEVAVTEDCRPESTEGLPGLIKHLEAYETDMAETAEAQTALVKAFRKLIGSREKEIKSNEDLIAEIAEFKDLLEKAKGTTRLDRFRGSGASLRKRDLLKLLRGRSKSEKDEIAEAEGELTTTYGFDLEKVKATLKKIEEHIEDPIIGLKRLTEVQELLYERKKILLGKADATGALFEKMQTAVADKMRDLLTGGASGTGAPAPDDKPIEALEIFKSLRAAQGAKAPKYEGGEGPDYLGKVDVSLGDLNEHIRTNISDEIGDLLEAFDPKPAKAMNSLLMAVNKLCHNKPELKLIAANELERRANEQQHDAPEKTRLALEVVRRLRAPASK